MNISEAVASLETLDPRDTIVARPPFTAASECILVTPDGEGRVQASVKDAGFVYFLEVYDSREVLEEFRGAPPTLDEKVRLLIHYAVMDAFPDWLDERNG